MKKTQKINWIWKYNFNCIHHDNFNKQKLPKKLTL